MAVEDLTEERRKALADLKSALAGKFGERLRVCALFGSYARGDFDSRSDVDVAIVIDGLTREIKDGVIDIVADIELRYLSPLATLIFSKEEFDFLKARERRIALDIEAEGIPL